MCGIAAAMERAEQAWQDELHRTTVADLARYVMAAAPPAAAASFSSSGQYFDLAISSTNEFSSLAIQNCALNGGDSFEWFNPSANSGAGAWQPVVGDPGPSYTSGPPACVSVTLDSTTSPSLSQLTGTVFGVAIGLPAATPEAPLTVVLPATGFTIMGAWFGLRRRRTRTA
jgi:hypothetical protein